MAIGHNLTVAGGTLTTSASNFGLTIGGDVTVGATFRWNGSAVAIAGNLTNNGTIVPGTSTLTLNGSAGQTIGGAAATPAFHLVINDPLGVTLNANLTVTGTLTLTSGQLNLGEPPADDQQRDRRDADEPRRRRARPRSRSPGPVPGSPSRRACRCSAR